jgi:hypothetical protein
MYVRVIYRAIGTEQPRLYISGICSVPLARNPTYLFSTDVLHLWRNRLVNILSSSGFVLYALSYLKRWSLVFQMLLFLVIIVIIKRYIVKTKIIILL